MTLQTRRAKIGGALNIRTLALILLLTCRHGLAEPLWGAEKPFAIKKVDPSSVEALSAREPGFVELMDVQLGDLVKTDQILVKLDHERQLFTVMSAKLRSENLAGIKIAESELREKTAALDIAMRKLRKRQISDEEAEQVHAQVAAAAAKVEQARVAIELLKLEFVLAERLLENRFIRSPMDGTVVEVSKPRGARVNQGDVILTVADLANLSVEVPVTKDSLSRLSVGSFIPIRLAGGQIIRNAEIQSITPMEGDANGAHSVQLIFENLSPETPLSELAVEALLPEDVKPAGIPTAPGKKPTSVGKP